MSADHLSAYAAAAGTAVAAVALGVSAYQTWLIRQDLHAFRQANRHERLLDGCIDYLTAADDLASVFRTWAGRAIGDGPVLPNEVSAEQYAALARDRAVTLMEREGTLRVVGTAEMNEGIGKVANVRVAVLLMTEAGDPGSRENADLWATDLSNGIETVRASCTQEIGA